MRDHAEQLVGTLFRILADEGHTDAQQSLLEAYRAEATTDREELAESLFSDLVGVLDRDLDTEAEVDVLATAVERLLDRFSAVIATAPVAVLVVDASGAIQLWNDGAERIFGWEEAEVRHRPYPELLATASDTADSFRSRLRSGETVEGVETRHSHRDGSILDVRVWAAPFRTQDGTFDGGTFVVSDITAQKQREQRLAVLNRVLRHNIRNDVTLIRGHLDLLADELDGDSEHVEVIDDRLRNVVELSDAARHVEQLSAGSDDERTTFDLGALLRARVDRLRAGYPGVDVRASVPASAPVVAHELLPYALDNVLENALEHNDSATPRVDVDVSVQAEDDREYAVVSIADDGPGLPAVEREVLTAEMETPLNHSSGMGLWLTRWICRSSDGTLAVRDSYLGGTCVRIQLKSRTDA